MGAAKFGGARLVSSHAGPTIVNTYHLGIPSQSAGQGLMAVLVALGPGAYRVYEGIVALDVTMKTYDADRVKAAEWVMLRGTKCSPARARTYFPSLKDEELST